jgi:hypothetical protein
MFSLNPNLIDIIFCTKLIEIGMHTKVVINFNERVFGNCGFLFPIHAKEQMTT